MTARWNWLFRRPSVKAGALVLLIGLPVFLALPFPRLPGMIPEGLIYDQYTSTQLLEVIKEGRFLELLLKGALPSGRSTYHCPVMAYLFLPFLYVFGPDWMLVRYWPLLFAVFTLLFTFWFMRDNFGETAGYLTLLLLAIHPSYVIGLRLGNYLWFPMQFFSMGALFFLSRWWHTRRTAFLGGASFLLGVGLSTQLWFVWFVLALVLMGLAFRRRLIQRFAFSGWTPAVSVAAACLLLGSALLLYRDITHGFDSLKAMLRLSVPSRYGPMRYFDNFPLVFTYFNQLLAGRLLFGWLFNFEPASAPGFPGVLRPHPDGLYPLLVWGSVVFLALRAMKERSDRTLFPVGLFLAMFAQSPVSLQHPTDQHLFFLYPFPQILVAVAVDRALGWRRGRLWLAAALCLVLAKEARCLETYYRQLAATGGAKHHSEVVYGLADWLASEQGKRVQPLVVLKEAAPTLISNLRFLLPKNRPSYVIVDGETAETAAETFGRVVRKERDVFILHDALLPSGYARLRSWAIRNGGSVRLVRRFHDDNGELLFEVHAFRLESPQDRKKPPPGPADPPANGRGWFFIPF